MCSINNGSPQVIFEQRIFPLILISTIQQIFCLSPLLLMHIWCQITPLWVLFERSICSFRLQPQSPTEVTSKIWTSIIPFSDVTKEFTALSVHLLHVYKWSRVFFDWQFSRLMQTLIPSGASKPVGLPHSQKAIFMGLSGGHSLSPRVSPLHAPFFLAPVTFYIKCIYILLDNLCICFFDSVAKGCFELRKI